MTGIRLTAGSLDVDLLELAAAFYLAGPWV